MKFLAYSALSALLIFPMAGFAQETAQGVFYLGAGVSSDEGETSVDATPFAIGAYASPQGRPLIVGFDLGREGTMLDSTFGSDDLRQAFSYNFLIGGVVNQSPGFRTDAMALIGVREGVADCPDSFLGFQCYADSEPDVEYEVNFGGVVNFAFDGFTTGVRVTGESAQVIVGLEF